MIVVVVVVVSITVDFKKINRKAKRQQSILIKTYGIDSIGNLYIRN